MDGPPDDARERDREGAAHVIETEEVLRRRARDLAAFNDLAVELAEVDSLASIFRVASDLLRQISGAAAVVIAGYEPDAKELRVRHVSAGRAFLRKANELAGGSVEAIRTPVGDFVKEAMLSCPRVKTFDGLHELTGGRVPRSVAALLEKTLGLGDIYAVALRHGGELLGGVAVLTAKGRRPYSAETLENFANVVAGAIRRKRVDEALRKACDESEVRVRERTAELTAALKNFRESEEIYRKLIETAPDGVSVTDLSGKITYASPQAAALHGFDRPEALVGRQAFDFLAEEDRGKAAAEFQAAVEKGFVHGLEFKFLREGGDLFVGELNATLLKDEEGRPSGFVATTRDITERRQAEEALRRALAEKEALLEAIPDLMFIINKEGTYVDFKRTDARALALASESTIGKNIRDTGFSSEDENKVLGRLEEALRTGAMTTAEYELQTPRGPGVYEARFVKLSDDEVLSVVRDITERKQAVEALRRAHDELEARVRERTAALEQSNEELRSFTYLVSHDMRAPLVNLQGFAAELRAALENVREATKAAVPYLDDDRRKVLTTALGQELPEALSFIEASVKRMDGFINGVLKLSRLGRRDLEIEPLDMTALVRETLKTLRHQLEERGAVATVAPLPEIAADRTAMEQIMGNLLANAVFYLQPGRPGEIEVTGAREDGRVVVRVRDNGRGITPNDLKKIFEPFTRVGEPSGPGEGMGLACVQTLVRRHGGRIWCESEPGVGTTFTFTVPQPPGEGAGRA